MKSVFGSVFSLTDLNPTISGCTVSTALKLGENELTVFSLDGGTDISAEIYGYHKLIMPLSGGISAFTNTASSNTFGVGEFFVSPINMPIGTKADTSAVYIEIMIRSTDSMNNAIKPGEIVKIGELVPYADGKIVNMDIVHNEKFKFVIMAFDAGTGLTEHAAPGEALVFAIDGEGVIGYEGSEYTLHTGESFMFAKGGKHYVKAVSSRFKMALLLSL